MSQPAQSNIDVTIGKTGFNPYRLSQLEFNDDWKKANMAESEAKVYLGAIKESANSPNMILDLRIPQNQKYQQVTLDEALSRYLSGEIDEDTAIATIESGWNELNDEIGKDGQLEIYKNTLGVQR
jgi:multiple sugar transport system substrate-binding protein